jgi:hypothetical protein
MWLALFGIGCEIGGFLLVEKSARRLVLKEGSYAGDRHVDPKTGQPPAEIEGPPNPKFYRSGIYVIIAGLVFQFADVIASLNQVHFNSPF